MGCTEIPLALEAGHVHAGLYLADPTQIMARVLALRAYGVEDVATVWPS